MASSLSQAQNWNHKRRKDVSGSFINETLGAFWLRQAGPIQSLDHSLSVPPSLSSPPFPQYAQCFTQFFSPILLFTMLVFSSQGLFSVARQEICKNIWSFFSPPFLSPLYVLDESSYEDGPLFPTQAVSPPCSALPHCGTGRGAHWLTGAPLEGGSTATSPPGPTHWSATAAQPRPYIFWLGILKGKGYLVDKKLIMC